MPTPYRANILKYMLFVALRGAAMGTSIVLWVIFLQRHYGYSLTQVTLLDIPFWIGKFLFEIPTGVVADKFGRKLSLAVSGVLGSLIWLVFTLSGKFYWMAAAQFVGGMAATFSSGADEALLFESVRAEGRESDYVKISGRARAVETLFGMLSGLVMGVIGEVNLLVPCYITAALLAATLIPLMMIRETGGKALTEGRTLPYVQILRQAVSALREHVILRWTIAYLLILGSVSFYAITFLQPYAVALGLSVAALGPVMVAYQGVGIAGSILVGRVQKTLGTGLLLYGAPVLLVPCLLLMGLAPVPPVLAAAAVGAFVFALTQPVLLAVIQGRVPDHTRATVLSIQSLLFTVFLSTTEPALGVLADRFGVQASYVWMAALVAVFCVPLLWWGRRWLYYGHTPEQSTPIGEP